MDSQIMAKYIVLLAFFIALCGGQVIEEMQVIPSEVNVGDNVQLICPISELGVGPLLYWKKYLHPEGEFMDEKEEDLVETWSSLDLGLNLDIDDVNLSRLVADAIPHPDVDGKYNFHLNISDVRVSDAGYYTCQLKQSPFVSELKVGKLVVFSPLETLDMTLTHAEDDQAFSSDQQEKPAVVFGLDHEVTVRCEATGGSPVPQLSIMLGDQDLWEATAEDLRQESVLRNYEDVKNPDDIDGTKLTYTKILEVTATIDFNFAGKEITCKASSPASDESKSVGFEVKMEGMPPMFIDCPTELNTKWGVANVKFSCVYTSDSPLKKALVEWYTDETHEEMFHEVAEATYHGMPIDGGKYYAELSDSEDGEKSITFTFERMAYQMFRNYTFIIENDLGTAKHTFAIVTDDVYSNSSNYMGASLVATVIMMMASTWLW